MAFVVERSQVVLFSGGPEIRVFEETGSQTMTVRNQASQFMALLVKNATAVAKITGLTPPAGF